jgi:tRNA pseudouridine55 synthase
MRSELNGIIVVDKPKGMTSARVVAEVKKTVGAARVGHTGTLDPFATGVLICCINQATRLARFFLHGDKRYEGLLRLGSTTDTQDATGQLLETLPVPKLDQAFLENLFKRFEGRQWQRPPVYAALKHEGTPLYKLARQGRPVQKPARPVTIKRLRILQAAPPDVRFEVACSAGTYVRTLCHDIGQAVGCGGHLAELRRTESCGFDVATAVSLDRLGALSAAGQMAEMVIPMAEALKGIPAFRADDDMVTHIGHGRQLAPEPFTAGDPARRPADLLKVVDRENRLRAVIEWSPEKDTYIYCCVFK